MPNHSHCETIVIGAGAMGSAAAYHLAKNGHQVTLIEQFALGHNQGSSHGVARITRHSYSDQFYAELMPAAFDAWRKLEADAGESLFIRTGGVSFGPTEAHYVELVASSLDAIGVPFRRMSGADWTRGHRAFRLPDDFDVVFEPDAGLLRASRILELELELALQHNSATRILAETPVLGIDLDRERPRVRLANGTITADRLIVTAGTWTGKLLPALQPALQPTRQTIAYIRPSHSEMFEIGKFPVFIFKGPGDLDAFYGMPSGLGMAVKVARHGGPPIDPNAVNREVTESDLQPVRDFVAAYLPSLAEGVIDRIETCLYNMTSDEHFQLGFLPGRNDVIVASPCSGHGFKFSCLIGEILADLAVSGQARHDITPWRLRIA